MSKNILRKFEDAAAYAAIKGKGVYERLELEKRLTGMGIGAKTALILSWRAGPAVMKASIIFGSAAGLIGGPEAIDRFNKWLEEHEKRLAGNDNNEPDEPIVK